MAWTLTMPVPDAIETVEELEISLLLEGLYRLYGADFRGYEKWALKSKLHGFVQTHGMGSISALQARALHDAMLAKELIRDISQASIASSGSPERFRALRQAVLPLLRSSPWPRIWVAECSHAAPVISLAIMLEEEGLYDKTQLFATVANEDCLSEISALRLAANDIALYEDWHQQSGAQRSLRDYCIFDGDDFELAPAMRRNIVWAQHDLASDASMNEFELIVCQRPLAEFGFQLQRRALRLFSDSLCTFGVLQIEPCTDLGATGFAVNYTTISSEQGIYRRAA